MVPTPVPRRGPRLAGELLEERHVSLVVSALDLIVSMKSRTGITAAVRAALGSEVPFR
jgi:hypothetical protein